MFYVCTYTDGGDVEGAWTGREHRDGYQALNDQETVKAVQVASQEQRVQVQLFSMRPMLILGFGWVTTPPNTFTEKQKQCTHMHVHAHTCTHTHTHTHIQCTLRTLRSLYLSKE